MQQVVSSLKSIISPDYNDEIDFDIHVENKKELPNESLSSDLLQASMEGNTFDLSICDLIEDYDLESIENDCNPDILVQAEKLFMEIFNSEDTTSILIDKLITLLSKTQDEGNTYKESKYFISHCITLSNKTLNDVFNWLLENQTKPQYVFFLGFFYFHGIDTEKNHNKSFKLFLKAAEDNCPIAQVYLSICYKDGFGTTINENLVFKWMSKAALNGSIYGQICLGYYCYEGGLGTDQDFNKAFDCYQKVANDNILFGLFNLGRCYLGGMGVEKDENKAIEIYKKLAIKGYLNAQSRLGYCYHYGKGVEKDEIKAFDFYKQAAKKGNNMAQNNLGTLYNNGKG